MREGGTQVIPSNVNSVGWQWRHMSKVMSPVKERHVLLSFWKVDSRTRCS